jgi:hypothetical protein
MLVLVSSSRNELAPCNMHTRVWVRSVLKPCLQLTPATGAGPQAGAGGYHRARDIKAGVCHSKACDHVTPQGIKERYHMSGHQARALPRQAAHMLVGGAQPKDLLSQGVVGVL